MQMHGPWCDRRVWDGLPSMDSSPLGLPHSCQQHGNAVPPTIRAVGGSGSLDEGEIRLAIKNVAPQITEVEITLMLATSDTDQDGKITFNEWKELMLHDHSSDVSYWEKYGERDMMVGLKDRRKDDTKKKHTPMRRNKSVAA